MQPPPNDLPHRALRNFLVSDSFSLHGWAIIDHFDSVHDCGLRYRQLVHDAVDLVRAEADEGRTALFISNLHQAVTARCIAPTIRASRKNSDEQAAGSGALVVRLQRYMLGAVVPVTCPAKGYQVEVEDSAC